MLRALRTVLATYDGLTLRAGVNRGPAFCGDIGTESCRSYNVMGDTVNLAARLTSRADPGGLLTTADVLERARTRFETTTQSFLLKGKERPITAYHVGAVLGEKEDEPQAELPFVGREAELAALALAVNGARVRQQQVVELIGEPGIGKSRLLDELKKQALGFTQLGGRCDQYSSASAYSVFRDLLRPLVGLTPEMDAREAGANLHALDRRGDARPGAAGAADRRSLRRRGPADAGGRRSSTPSSGAIGCTSASGRCSRASC